MGGSALRGSVPPAVSGLTLTSVGLFVCPYLSDPDWKSMCCLGKTWVCWELYADCPLACPHPPHCRRLQGFGKLNPNLQVSHLSPSPYFIIHKAWDFLSPPDRAVLGATTLVFEAYARLR